MPIKLPAIIYRYLKKKEKKIKLAALFKMEVVSVYPSFAVPHRRRLLLPESLSESFCPMQCGPHFSRGRIAGSESPLATSRQMTSPAHLHSNSIICIS